MEVLQIKNLCKSFKRKGLVSARKVKVLENVTLSIEREVFGFIGPNGAGKTTTIKIVMNFIRPDSGEVKIFGKDSTDISVKKKIGFLPERPYIYTSISGKEYLNFCADVYNIPWFERKRKFKNLLDLVDLIGVEENPISSYSKGMVQRLLFASTLINDPDLLILDEPMSGLDPMGRNIIAQVIKNLKEKGKAVFYSSHIIQDVERLSDRVGVIVDGKIKLIDSVANLMQKFSSGYLITFRETGSSKIDTLEVERENLWSKTEELRKNSCEIISIEPLKLSLEDILVGLVKVNRTSEEGM